MKKQITIFIALTALLSSCSAPATPSASAAVELAKDSGTFKDIGTHWAKQSIVEAVAGGYVDGYEDGTFRPDQNVSRAEFLKMIITATKEPVMGNTTGAEWFHPYVAAAKEKGILRDSDFAESELNAPISRLEMSRIAVRATDVTFANKAVQLDDKSAMYNATKSGLIQGLDRGELAPNDNTTRAQAVTIIDRVLKVKSGIQLPVDKYAVSNAELALKKTNIFTMIPELFGGKQWDDASWNPENLYLETPDKKFKGTLDWVIAIDLADPNDPNRYLLGDVDKLTWDTYSDVKAYIKDYPSSYILIFKTHVDYCDSTQYACDIGLQAYPAGFKQDVDALSKGILNTYSEVSLARKDTFSFIFPKNGYKTKGTIQLCLFAPVKAFTNPIDKTVLAVVTSEQH